MILANPGIIRNIMKVNISFIPRQVYMAPEAVVVELRTDSALLQASQLDDYDENIIFAPGKSDVFEEPTIGRL